jgi:hypothetical protein
MLLDNSFNLSINPPVSDNTYSLAISNCINLYFLIYILINNIYDKYNTDKKNYENKIKENQYIIKPYILPIKIDDKYEKILKLVDLNSLDRQIMLYFIFKMHGKFTSDTYINSYESIIDENTSDTSDTSDNIEKNVYNSFYEYNFWCNVYGSKNNFNLDETLSNNLIIIKDDKKWELNKSHINFLYWLNYSGLYDYIFAEEQIHIKKYILDDMNYNKVLIGDSFLKYQLFLITYEEMFTELLDINLSDTLSDKYTECDNDVQPNKIVSVLGIVDIDKYSIYNICRTTCKAIYKSIFDIWND